ncbi:MAG: 30S ribosomal protein S16 [Patescibacteria group bacterium]|nr:30S ribosomal protein S16 [Patescibacteria group bacterium]
MLKIRLAQTGAKNKRKYRIIAIEEGRKRDGKAKEILGYYDPTVKPPIVKIETERIVYWQSVGAQITDAVKKLMQTK